MTKQPRTLPPVGTPCRINLPGHEMHGRHGWIVGENDLERFMGKNTDVYWFVDTPTFDNEDVLHWHFSPSEVEELF